jgi:hypothetical protein
MEQEKTFVCEPCDKVFSCKFNLQRHLKTDRHMRCCQTKTYTCEPCNYTTKQKSNYDKHCASEKHKAQSNKSCHIVAMRKMTLDELIDHEAELYEDYEAFRESIDREIERLHEKVFGKMGSICYATKMCWYKSGKVWNGYNQDKRILDEIDELDTKAQRYRLESGLALCTAMIADLEKGRCSSKITSAQ